MVRGGALTTLANLSITLVSSIILVLIGIAYFMLITWIIKLGARWSGFTGLDGNWVVMTAGIITAAIVIGSAVRR